MSIYENMKSNPLLPLLGNVHGANVAILLAYLLEEEKSHSFAGKQFAREFSEIEEDTTLGRAAQRTATEKLYGLGIFEEEPFEKDHKYFFRINYDRLGDFLSRLIERYPFGVKRGPRRKR